MDRYNKEPIRRVDVYMEKGGEEFLPEEIYNQAGKGIWIDDINDFIVIRCYPHNIELFLESINNSTIDIKHISVEEEAPIDYSALTKRYFKTITVCGVKITPPWAKKISQGSIIIDPGMAFGTGRHESTRIMMKLMQKMAFKDKRVIDIGCGSGILSIYATSLGAKEVFALDIDMEAVVSARKNARLNRMEDINFICSDLNDVSGAFDICLANLDIRTFEKNVKKISSLTEKHGHIVISGVLKKERKKAGEIFKDFQVIYEEYKNSWLGMILVPYQAKGLN